MALILSSSSRGVDLQPEVNVAWSANTAPCPVLSPFFGEWAGNLSRVPHHRRSLIAAKVGKHEPKAAQSASAPPQVAGAPGPSRLGTREATFLMARKRRLPHRRWPVHLVPRVWGPGKRRTLWRASAYAPPQVAVCPTAGGGKTRT